MFRREGGRTRRREIIVKKQGVLAYTISIVLVMYIGNTIYNTTTLYANAQQQIDESYSQIRLSPKILLASSVTEFFAKTIDRYFERNERISNYVVGTLGVISGSATIAAALGLGAAGFIAGGAAIAIGIWVIGQGIRDDWQRYREESRAEEASEEFRNLNVLKTEFAKCNQELFEIPATPENQARWYEKLLQCGEIEKLIHEARPREALARPR